jgi:1-acyl-sn-glycerol-3-phosphate acyltransferase
MVFFMWKLWLKSVHGTSYLPGKNDQVIFVSNHVSYYDFFILASVLEKQTIFLASSKLQHTPFVNWFMKLDTILYVDIDKPGYSFFKKLYGYLNGKKNIVIYPEGTRSRSGRMLLPKPGFVKLALRANLKIVPIAMAGTFEILPPHRHFPRLKRCDMHILPPVSLDKENPDFRDIFEKYNDAREINARDRQIIAIRIMNKIREVTHQEWDGTVYSWLAKTPEIKNELALT